MMKQSLSNNGLIAFVLLALMSSCSGDSCRSQNKGLNSSFKWALFSGSYEHENRAMINGVEYNSQIRGHPLNANYYLSVRDSSNSKVIFYGPLLVDPLKKNFKEYCFIERDSFHFNLIDSRNQIFKVSYSLTTEFAKNSVEILNNHMMACQNGEIESVGAYDRKGSIQ